VQVVLSVMNNLEQMNDNLHTFSEDSVLSESDQAVLKEAAEKFRAGIVVPCTACRYCTEGCPMQINIPDLFKIMNRDMLFGNHADSKRRYANATKDGGLASSCIGCLQCEGECPQHIEITARLREIAEAFE
jgi:predicted aldo/keto reductase-like oxidoreductase